MRHPWIGTAVVISTASLAYGQQQTMIQGTLTNAVTLAPVGGTSVLVSLYDAAGSLVSTVQPDAAGHYQFQTGAGTYFLKVREAPGYVTELYDNIACIAADCPPTVGTPVVLFNGSLRTIDFALSPGGSFSGSVRRASDGSGLSGLLVFVYNASTSLVKTVATGAGGAYSVDGLATGTYFARVALATGATGPIDYIVELYGGLHCPARVRTSAGAIDFSCRIASGAPIPVTTGAATTGIDFSLDGAATISGRVVADGTMEPVSLVPVFAYEGDVAVSLGLTDAFGRYTIPGLSAGAYRVRTVFGQGGLADEWYGGVCVGCPGTPLSVTVGAGAAVTGIDFSLGTAGAISGAITCQLSLPSDWFALPTIHAYSSTGVLVRQTSSFGACLSGSPTGTYTIAGLAPGQYFLVARDFPFVPFGIRPEGGHFIDMLYGGTPCVVMDCDPRRGLPVTVAAGHTTSGVDFVMTKGFSSNQFPASPALRLFDARGVELQNVLRTGPLFLPPSQHFVGVPPGTYYAMWGDQHHGGLRCASCPPTSGKPIVLGTGAGLALEFGPVSVRRVSGTVTNASGGGPLSTVTVELFSEAGGLVGSAVSDMSGAYSITAVEPGTYFARTRNDRGYVDELFAEVTCASCDPRGGTPIVVGSTDMTDIDFTLAAGGVLTGMVADTVGGLLRGVPISLFTSGGVLAGRATSLADGQFRATLPAGSYRARADASPSHGAEVFSEQPCTSGACDVTAGAAISVSDGAVTPNINFTLASCGGMTLSPPLLATGVVSRSYRQTFSVSGGTLPASFRVTDGALPAGLTLNPSSGVLDGTTTVSGRHVFTVGAVDANGCGTAQSFTLDVHECAFALSPSSATLPAAGGTVVVTIADACGSQEVSGFSPGGWVLVTANTPGQVTLSVSPNAGAASRSGPIAIGRRVFEVHQAGTGSQPPFGLLEVPADGAQVSGAVAVGGWALDDLGVARVQIYRNTVGAEAPGLVFLGNAVFVPGARPDVAAAFPSAPENERAGFGFMILTNMLPNQGNGTFIIHAVAEDVEGVRVLLGSRTIVGNNADAAMPFGTLDRPDQGETIGGASYINWGWALTPQTATIPSDGSTIQVIVDGVPVGNPTYNLFRPDVSGAFPDLANTPGPVGFRAIDTTALAEGLHTISWLVTDNQSRTAGIGSRYFTVSNSADAQASASQAVVRQAAVSAAKPIGVPAAPDSGRHAASLDLARPSDASVVVQRDDGPKRRLRSTQNRPHALTIAPMERLELSLGEADQPCSATWAGYLVKDGVLGDLPVGASLDRSGTFYWQTGPGFAGRFALLFVRTDCDGSKHRLPVVVTIENR